MERLGKIDKKNIFYFHWNDEKRNFYLENLPIKRWVMFVIGDEKLNEDYKILAEKSADVNLVELHSAGDECELIHDIFDNVIIQKKKDRGEPMDSPDDFENTAMTAWWTEEFDWGYWTACYTDDYRDYDEKIRTLICVDFTDKGVKNCLLRLTKMIRKGWVPSEGKKNKRKKFSKPFYDDEIKKPLRKSQKGFEKY